MNRARKTGGYIKHNVGNSNSPGIGSKCAGDQAKPIQNALAAQPKKQGYAPVDNALTGKRKF